MIVRLFASSLLLLASCASDPTEPPTLQGPAGLIASVTWPSDPSAIQAVFDELPIEIDGMTRDETSALTATYGEGALTAWAEDMSAAECPGLAGVDLIRAALERGGAVTIDDSSETDLPYVLAHRTDDEWMAAWMVPGTAWIFVVQATSTDLLDAGVEALVSAAPQDADG